MSTQPHHKRRGKHKGRPLKHEANRIAPKRSSPDAAAKDQDRKSRVN